MPSDQTTCADHPLAHGGYENYLVLAADMSTCDGETIDDYQLVMASARSEAEALETASAALESQAGCEPLASFTAATLRELADGLCTRKLEPCRAYNLSMGMTDTEVAESDQDIRRCGRARRWSRFHVPWAQIVDLFHNSRGKPILHDEMGRGATTQSR